MRIWVFHIRSFFRRLRYVVLNGWLLQGYQSKLPDTLIWEPTNICNLKCPFCPHGNQAEARPSGFMDCRSFDDMLRNIDVPLKTICFYLHGEPFLNKDLAYFTEQIGQLGISTTIYSNGYNIDLGLLERVLVSNRQIRFSFSIDILSKDYYEQIRRPANYERMLSCLEAIHAVFERHKRSFELSMAISPDEIGRNKDLFDELFCKYDRLKRISVGSKFPWPEYFYTGDLPGRLSEKKELCKQAAEGLAVYWNGDVTLCSYDYSGKLKVGNLAENKLSAIFNSPEARRIRKSHFLKKLGDLPLCKHCILPRYNSSVEVINRRKKQQLGHEKPA